MKTFKFFCLLTILIFVESCNNPSVNEQTNNAPDISSKNYVSTAVLMNDWDCPDNIDFPAIDIKSWNQVPIVNGRLPTYEETQNGTALLYIDKNVNPDLQEAKPYDMMLPKLAYFTNPRTKKEEIVIVIQIVEFTNFIWVGFRYLTGGNGASKFKEFRFLSDSEVENAVK
ncbi:MAG: hypothetical protein Q7W45_05385 [Bacteroidota bacterium]|nr:hypothetical protein [Bacteroidota bacterium]MDP3144880.1 hypothetical protein [Bacteroidota bacterium]MDP3557110.1 hypothetical protein [Bacteroidota bacterium]